MKKLLFVAIIAAFGASTALVAANDQLKENSKAQVADIAGQAMSGKSAKEIAADKKAEAKEAVKDEAGKQLNKFLNKF